MNESEGYELTYPDGEYGQQTKIALYQFQQKNGLEADNICG